MSGGHDPKRMALGEASLSMFAARLHWLKTGRDDQEWQRLCDMVKTMEPELLESIAKLGGK